MKRHYYTMDGSSMEFGSDFRGPREQIAHLLSLLQPDKRSTFILGPMPDEANFVEYVYRGGSPVYLQCAGTSDAMTIEWHKYDDDGQDRHYIVGRGGDHSGEPTAEIPYFDGKYTATVYPDEVFALDEATDIFFHYYETGEIPAGYELRWYDLTWPKTQT
ncbi:hypothetical protein QE418_001026 [Microbacterium testaceum]|uniref:hypothetical protein n=1 Tax=Microbacterium TaxID=33882 RepID=UPI00277F9484|nr:MULTISPECIES: hypothetical protein [Microbacterium]MDQ1111578.1 hypothetical protein [Microbacterium testaceum]MDR6097887.1 hypothetical protein [Microbacterium sp. SORGH_AS_0454]